MTLLDSGKATQDVHFRLRVQAAMFQLAQNVLNEDPATPGHVTRAGLARSIVFTPGAQAEPFIWLCAANPVIAAAVASPDLGDDADGDVLFVVSSNWNTVAGWSATSTSL